MNEPDQYDTSRAWSWRHAIAKSGLPPVTRLVLHTLGLKMDSTGGSCYPPISELVDLTGLDKKTVLKHLDIAEENGWIEVAQHGFRGQKWKRNEYQARWPGRDLAGSAMTENCAENDPQNTSSDEKGGGAAPPPTPEKVVEMVPEGGGTGSRKVVEEIHQDKILPANIPANLPTAGAEGGDLKKDDRKKVEFDFVMWFANWQSGDVNFARNTWQSLSAEERAACIERTDAFLRWKGWTSRNERCAAASYLKNRSWTELPETVASQPERTRGVAKVCGKLWMGTRLRALSQPPTGRLVVTRFEEMQIASGKISREDVLLRKRMDHGWPLVTEMRDLARHGDPFLTSLDLKPHLTNFQPVQRGTALFAAWEDLHSRRGWPFIESQNPYPWFPPVADDAGDLNDAVERALETFLSAANEASDDAA